MGFFRPDASVFFQGDDISPFLLCNGGLDLLVIISAVGEDKDVMGIMGTNILFQIELLDVVDNGLIFGSVDEAVIFAIPLAVERYWGKRNERFMDKKNDVRPLVADDEPLAVVESFGIVRVEG